MTAFSVPAKSGIVTPSVTEERRRGCVMSPRSKQYLGLGIIVAVVVGVVLVILRSERPRDLVLQIEPVSHSADVTVYIGGAVAEPGLYTLPRGSRVAHAIELAGTLPEADLAAISMARELRNEESIAVPFQMPSSDVAPLPSGSASPSNSAASSGNPPVDTSLINVNTASASELERLPGVGPAIAARILEFRESNGPFATLDDLARVQGISARMVEEFRALATVES
jgi:competence protein ComEA